MPSIDLFPLEKEKIEKIFKDNFFCHFFVQIDSMLFEIRSAPIHPSSDLKRTTTPGGFFFAARVWDKNFISKLELQTSSQITLLNTSNVKKIGGSVTDKDYTISVVETLVDWKDEALIQVISQSDFPILKTSAEVFNKQIISLLAFSILVLLVVSFFLIKNVSNPLKIMAKGLEEFNRALLVDLQKTNQSLVRFLS